MELFATFVDSRICGGYYVDVTEEGSRAMAKNAIEKLVEAKYRYLHDVCGTFECVPGQLQGKAIALSDAAAPIYSVCEYAREDDEHSWDFTDVTGL
ncbi:hypothetical protein HUU62_08530 [Rhodoferax sp. 4810]|uniref:Uncharacterized protein n=1 Tax=Thiospirillum jenense TaxID=1653858 RepID=A0A839HEG8_9GAMM|nr:hypothetical protein [Thiospirillum jenense]MBB1074454.1 hypothetical protein [Rhodoferax jenense]MBB1125567.1 hypothetical protein [Thiospirillum jenense]